MNKEDPQISEPSEVLEDSREATLRRAEEVAARILARQGTALESTQDATRTTSDDFRLEWEDRKAVGRSATLSTDLDDVSEVEYRQVRLERVVLVGLRQEGSAEDAENSLRELAALAETAGSQVLGGTIQRRAKPDPATYLGKGKAAELRDLVRDLDADTVIVDSDLAPSQRRGLEDVVGVKVVDRTALILDIFAQHAQSREGKAQVELAQLEYLLPRLRGWGESMSRQAGGRVAGGEGIGSRGPGETKIELDRRRIRTRMSKLREQIKKMTPARTVQRSSRRRGEVPAVAIAGYTNAGKSTLMNRLTGSDILVQDALFATLDPTVRRSETPDGRTYTLTDTVGFVRNLPTQLVEAFRSTLEEIGEADVILHVVDAAHQDPVAQVQAVRSVLQDIEGYDPARELIVLNKVDLASPERLAVLRAAFPGAVSVSAETGYGIEKLQEAIGKALPRPSVEVDLVIPFEESRLVSAAHETGEVLSQEWSEHGTRLHARVDRDLAQALREVALSVPAEHSTAVGQGDEGEDS